MNNFTVTTDIDVALSLTNSKTLRGDLLKAKYMALVWYVEEMIHKHFDKPNPNMEYRYKPNKLTYEMWKKKYHPDAINQLVLTGRLKSAVERAKVDPKTGKISVSVPEYGIYQLEAGRDFLSPSWYDEIEIQNRIRRNLFHIRSERMKLVKRK
jgi:hypothetical protein